jgi:hypothetical protein
MSDGPDLLSALAHFLGTTPEALAGGEAEAVRARLDRVRAALGKLIAAGAGEGGDPADPQALPADVARLREALARAGIGAAVGSGPDQADAPRLDAAGGIDPAALHQALATLASWFEAQEPGAGRSIDALVAELDKLFGGAAAAAEAERDRRIRGDARAAIAERLRQVGIKPSDDS